MMTPLEQLATLLRRVNKIIDAYRDSFDDGVADSVESAIDVLIGDSHSALELVDGLTELCESHTTCDANTGEIRMHHNAKVIEGPDRQAQARRMRDNRD